MKTTEQKVPTLRFPEFEGDWEEKKLGEVSEIITGKTPSTNDELLWNGNILFITPTDIIEGRKYQKETLRTVINQKEIKVLPLGSVVYTCIGSIGKIAITTIESCTNQQINSIVIDSRINNEFIYYTLKHLTPYIKSLPATTTLPIINKTEFSAIKISLPSLEEQTQIANFLSATDMRLELLKEKKQGLEDYKRGAMQGIFSQELRFTRADGSAYEDWEEKKLGEVCECLDNQRIPLNSSERASKQGKYPYWGANNIVDYIDEYIFDQTIILLAEDGGNFHEFQTKAIANIFTGKCWVNNHVHVLSANQEYSSI